MTEVMGLGKTFTGAEKMIELGAKVNLVVCQKSKINDWVDHFKSNYTDYKVFNLTATTKEEKRRNEAILLNCKYNTNVKCILVINYDLLWRRSELTKLTNFTLMLDESSLIQNETTKRSKFILKLKPANVILLSGTPTGGKYEKLYSQLKLLGWNISKTTYWNTYIKYHYEDFGGYPFKVIDGYKNVDRLKRKMREYGCHFLKTEDVLELPEQIFTTIKVDSSKEYKKFKKTRVVEVDNTKLIGDNTLTKMLYERQLCSLYSKNKLEAFRDLVNSTNDRLIVFYNFTSEYELLNWEVCDIEDKPTSIVNGTTKDLTAYEECENSVTFIQYQAGAKGLNLQLANKLIFFSPTLNCEDYMQSLKRIHRIKQQKTCYYYKLIVEDSIEEKIYKALNKGVSYTNKLFEEGE